MTDLNGTPIAQRCHISFFGCTNAGKSSLINAIANQNVSVVSDVKGTTTDPVKKTMEILPIGAVVLFDTAGFDDTSELGKLRIEKTNEILSKTDIAILVVDSSVGLKEKDNELIELFKKKNTPYLIVYNKSDLHKKDNLAENEIYVSSKTQENIDRLKEKIANFASSNKTEKFIITDKLSPKDTVILVIPIDEAAPKGRIILPQQNTLRELLDFRCKVICCQDSELKETLNDLKNKPKLVITDSQVFGKIKDIVPDNIYFTSFSILFARYKGSLKTLVEGAKTLENLKDGDNILISEGCTHKRQCNDIGSVKLPNWIKKYTGKNLNFEFTSGGSFPSDLAKYALIVHCGGCMLNEKEMQNRIQSATEQRQNIVNYGVLIAYMNGILSRSLEIFPEIM